MPSAIYRINKAGAYAMGHFNFLGMRLDLGSPEACCYIDTSKKEVACLLDILDIDWEAGRYVAEQLAERNVLVIDDIDGYPLSIGDPYGNRSMELKEARHV